MCIFLPITAWICLFFLFHKNNCWRSSTLLACLIWSLILTGITETLSFFRGINFVGLLLTWILINIILLLLYFKVNAKRVEKFQLYQHIPLNLRVLLSSVIFIVTTTGLIALLVPPNNWDSMSYHMARVAHWMQNNSVEHYPTSYLPQLYQSPWAEFTIMNFQILSGSDCFANLVQWFSMVGSLIGVSLVAQQLGASLSGQILTVVFAATLPMGILQSSSTQNDYVVSFWLVCLAYFVLVASESEINLGDSLKVGMSLGLAIFTKGTAYIYVIPFYIFFLITNLKICYRKSWNIIFLATIVALCINIGFYHRNWNLFGTPLFAISDYKVDEFRISLFISNIVRNMALHMAIPLDFINNNFLEQGIKQLHKLLGVDINDPRITMRELTFGMQGLSNFEDTAGNPIHFYLTCLAIAICLGWRKLRRQQKLMHYLITVSCAFLLFCLLLKWQNWNTRLHLPIFILFSAFLGIVFSISFNKRVYTYLAIFILTLSMFWVFFNTSKPFFDEQNIFNMDRVEQYFSIRSSLKDDYVGAVNFVKDRKCSQVGLSLRPDAWEYPLWVLLKMNGNLSTRIEQVNVNNVSVKTAKKHSYDKFFPCAIISVGPVRNPLMLTEYGAYVEKWSGASLDPVKVFVQANQ